MTTQSKEQEEKKFNPNDHLMPISNKDYLPVQWRLVWFRDICPQGTIDTEELAYDLDREYTIEKEVWNKLTRKNETVIKTAKGYARYHAIVTDGKGGRATGTKSECAVNFADFGEKAETGAIGRALAALGYGTQFTGDEFDEKERIVDSPVEPAGATTPALPPGVSLPPTPAPIPVASSSTPTPKSTPAPTAPKLVAVLPATGAEPVVTPLPVTVAAVASMAAVKEETHSAELGQAQRESVRILEQLNLIPQAKVFLDQEYGPGKTTVADLTDEEAKAFLAICKKVRTYAYICWIGKADPRFEYLLTKGVKSIFSLYRVHGLDPEQIETIAGISDAYHQYIIVKAHLKLEALCEKLPQAILDETIEYINTYRVKYDYEPFPAQVSTMPVKGTKAA